MQFRLKHNYGCILGPSVRVRVMLRLLTLISRCEDTLKYEDGVRIKRWSIKINNTSWKLFCSS